MIMKKCDNIYLVNFEIDMIFLHGRLGIMCKTCAVIMTSIRLMSFKNRMLLYSVLKIFNCFLGTALTQVSVGNIRTSLL